MWAALISSLAHTQVRTRARRRTHAGSGPSPPPNEPACPNDRSIAVRARYSALPKSLRRNSMLNSRCGLWWIADRRIVRLIRKWLRAGVSQDGRWSASQVGTPQGAVASPLLANVYRRHVFDLWVQQWRQRHAAGDVIAVRYADDFVLGFQHRHEAERILRDLHGPLK
jgi:hypothetical protein